MPGLGLPEFLALVVPMALIGLVLYGVIFYCIWKFYQMLSKINGNLAGIQRAIENRAAARPNIPS